MTVAAAANAAIVTFGASAHAVSARGAGAYGSQDLREQGEGRAVSVATQASGAKARTDVTRWMGQDEASLRMEFTHARDDSPFSLSHSRGHQQFSTNADIRFELTGFYAVSGGGSLRLHVFVYDLLREEFLVSEAHVSRRGGRLQLGNDGAAPGIAGVLAAGGRYAIWYHAYTFSWPGAGLANAHGELSLAIHGASQAVTEPPALMLMLAGIPLVLGLGRRRLRAQSSRS
ncbi:MAG: hypothetical protein AAGA68_13670 [Pseudomonadota bacterium]